MMKRFLLASIVLLAGSAQSFGSISYTTAGSGYTQDFNTLASNPTATSVATPWANDTTIVGWDARYLLNPQPTSYSANSGSGTSGLSSLGTINASDRALGATAVNANAASGSPEAVQYGVSFVNNTGLTLTDLTIGFTGEQWRVANATAQSLTFAYKTGAAVTIADTGFTSVSGFTFTSPTNSGTAASLDGNAAANRVVFAPTLVSGVSWGVGEVLYLRWNDGNEVGNDQSLGIDDFSFSATAVPEPTSMALIGLVGAAGCVVRARRRKPSNVVAA